MGSNCVGGVAPCFALGKQQRKELAGACRTVNRGASRHLREREKKEMKGGQQRRVVFVADFSLSSLFSPRWIRRVSLVARRAQNKTQHNKHALLLLLPASSLRPWCTCTVMLLSPAQLQRPCCSITSGPWRCNCRSDCSVYPNFECGMWCGCARLAEGFCRMKHRLSVYIYIR